LTQRQDLRLDLRDKLVVNIFLDHNAFQANAILASILKGSTHHRRHHLRQIRVFPLHTAVGCMNLPLHIMAASLPPNSNTTGVWCKRLITVIHTKVADAASITFFPTPGDLYINPT
jgi:hypothetical protein